MSAESGTVSAATGGVTTISPDPGPRSPQTIVQSPGVPVVEQLPSVLVVMAGVMVSWARATPCAPARPRLRLIATPMKRFIDFPLAPVLMDDLASGSRRGRCPDRRCLYLVKRMEHPAGFPICQPSEIPRRRRTHPVVGPGVRQRTPRPGMDRSRRSIPWREGPWEVREVLCDPDGADLYGIRGAGSGCSTVAGWATEALV